jgi:hypothetical protein
MLYADVLEHSVCSIFYTYLPMKMEQTECSETSAYKITQKETYNNLNIFLCWAKENRKFDCPVFTLEDNISMNF